MLSPFNLQPNQTRIKVSGQPYWIEKRPDTGICIMASAWEKGDIRYIVMGRISGETLFLYNRFTREEVPVNIAFAQSGYAALMALPT